MNPLLLKPEADTRSQIILMDRVGHALGMLPWLDRSMQAWPPITTALDHLKDEDNTVVIEEPGSPAEINLRHSDSIGMHVARSAGARCVLGSDFDRGGAFAHLHGTWVLRSPYQRKMLRGFVLNKFCSDAHLLAPARQMLEAISGIPTIGTSGMWWVDGLPEKDGVLSGKGYLGDGVRTIIAIIAYQHISNVEGFHTLRNAEEIH